MTEKEQYLKSFGERVRYYRTKQGLSRTELAHRCGYTTENARSTIHKIEMGKSDLPISKMDILAKALNVSPLDLLGYANINA